MKRRSTIWAFGFAVVMAALVSTAHASEALTPEAVRSAEETLLPFRNVLQLYLRIAGVVWIAAEWIAAGVLVAGYHLVRRHFCSDGPTETA